MAAAVGMSGMTYDKAKKVVEAADANPDSEQIQDALERMNKTGKASPESASVGIV